MPIFCAETVLTGAEQAGFGARSTSAKCVLLLLVMGIHALGGSLVLMCCSLLSVDVGSLQDLLLDVRSCGRVDRIKVVLIWNGGLCASLGCVSVTSGVLTPCRFRSLCVLQPLIAVVVTKKFLG